MSSPAAETWDSGYAYEQYVGRWSRTVAAEFLRWLAPCPGLAWADVGCGTGALASAILAMCEPSSVSGIDSSEGFVSQARQRIRDPRARFEIGDATHLPWDSAVRDVTVSGLVLNFVRDHESMVREMARVTRPGGSVAAYVWDYAGGMEMMRHFWDAAIAASPNDAKLDQAERFPLCQPGPLQALFERVELKSVTVQGFLLSSMVLQAARADIPWLLEEKRAAAVALPPMDGGKLAGFEIPLGEGLTLTVYVETASGRVVRSSGVLSSPDMKTNFATEYSDFRMVDGVLFPFREANYAGGQTTGVTVVTKLTVNPPLTEQDFRP